MIATANEADEPNPAPTGIIDLRHILNTSFLPRECVKYNKDSNEFKFWMWCVKASVFNKSVIWQGDNWRGKHWNRESMKSCVVWMSRLMSGRM